MQQYILPNLVCVSLVFGLLMRINKHFNRFRLKKRLWRLNETTIYILKKPIKQKNGVEHFGASIKKGVKQYIEAISRFR